MFLATKVISEIRLATAVYSKQQTLSADDSLIMGLGAHVCQLTSVPRPCVFTGLMDSQARPDGLISTSRPTRSEPKLSCEEYKLAKGSLKPVLRLEVGIHADLIQNQFL